MVTPRNDNLIPNAPGERRGGRQKGTPNKTTAVLKEAILAAAEAAGDDIEPNGGTVAYLKYLAATNSSAFATLLGKVLPMQVTGENGGPLKMRLTRRLDISTLNDEQLDALEGALRNTVAKLEAAVSEKCD